MSRRAGIIQVQVNGEVYDAKGNFSYNLGTPMREAIVGEDTIHGFRETPQVAFIEGEFTDRGTLDLRTLTTITDATVTCRLNNGKMVALYDAWFASDGTANTQEGNIAVRFESGDAEEIGA